MALIASLAVGLLALSITFYLLIVEVVFVQKATRFDATIVEVRNEAVQKGKGSVLAYVPIIEVPDATYRIVKTRVDTFSEEPVYKVGDRIKVLCDSSSLKCIPNSFIDKWGDSAIVLLVSLMFLSMPLLYYRKICKCPEFRTTGE